MQQMRYGARNTRLGGLKCAQLSLLTHMSLRYVVQCLLPRLFPSQEEIAISQHQEGIVQGLRFRS